LFDVMTQDRFNQQATYDLAAGREAFGAAIEREVEAA